MDTTADLQAQIIAIRTAVEGIWLSMLHQDPDAAANAQKLRQGNLDAFDALQPESPEAAAMRDAVMLHTDQLWQNILRQLEMRPAPDAAPLV